MIQKPSSEILASALRGARKSTSANLALYEIQGERVSAEQIGARIGCAATTVHRRLRRLSLLAGAVTWDALRASS